MPRSVRKRPAAPSKVTLQTMWKTPVVTTTSSHSNCTEPGPSVVASDPFLAPDLVDDCTESEDLGCNGLSAFEAYHALPQCVCLKVVEEASKGRAGNLCKLDISSDWNSFRLLFSKQSDVSVLKWLRKAGVEGDDVETSFILIREILSSVDKSTVVKRPSSAAKRLSEISD